MKNKFILLTLMILGMNGCVINNISQDANLSQTTEVNQTQPHDAPSSSASALPTEFPDLSGTWIDGGGTLIEIAQENAKLTATYPDERGPYQGELTGQSIIKMQFDDVGPDCCQGELKSDTIHWSDHTSWRKKD